MTNLYSGETTGPDGRPLSEVSGHSNYLSPDSTSQYNLSVVVAGLEDRGRSLSRWTAESNLPNAQWPAAAAIVQEVTGRHGFGTPEVIVDRPGDHRIVVPDPFGGTLTFGTASATILSMHTGCHLPPEEDTAAG